MPDVKAAFIVQFYSRRGILESVYTVCEEHAVQDRWIALGEGKHFTSKRREYVIIQKTIPNTALYCSECRGVDYI